MPEGDHLDPADVHRGHVRRLASLDPLLATGEPLRAGDGATLLGVRGPTGRAVAVTSRSQVEPDTEEALWGPLRTSRLRLQLDGDVAPDELGRLLRRWDDLVAADHEPGDRDSAALVTVPSRDVHLAEALAGHGLAPLLVVAARAAGRPGPVTGAVPARPATAEDLDDLAAMAVSLQEHDARFGLVSRREAAPRVLRDRLAEDLGGHDAPHWVIDGPDGRLAGFLGVQLPSAATWIAGAVAASSVAYLSAVFVRPEHRGRGFARALTAAAHERLDAAGVEVTVLHHALPNPTSTPFWAQQGYRPLLTTWVRRPAVAAPRSS
jgi:GNAT superfamily N-acetyltransferase